MNWLAYFMLYSIVSAFPQNNNLSTVNDSDSSENEVDKNTSCEKDLPETTEELLNRLLHVVKGVVINGDEQLGIPPLEPVEMDNYILVIPTALIFLNLNLKNISASGFGDFIIHEAKLDIENLTFDIDVEMSNLHIIADYNLLGYVYSVIPIYGKGRAEFHIEGFRFGMKLYLEQSEDGKSVLINKIENASYVVPHMKSHLTGVLGGGDIDAIVNALIEEVILGYVNRFHGRIATLASQTVMAVGNPVLHRLQTWCYINALQYN